ncbi:sugar transferase [Cyanobium sp. L1E-Cus]|uniref:sugar transferase n=1 Tax=Cyanobium sp. L1E-Cus TaxID=2823714 RepID=UPI0020CEA63A|nr:sugar transferase [Cyanobium sp. L1E-Cus]
MIKRLFDLTASAVGLVLASPVLVPVMFLVWLQDKHSPFYIAPRVGRNELPFKMIKLRSMVINADKSGIDSTAANDNRITALGQFIRRYKLDELTQLWNVLKGDMSLVGPRPNVKRETDLYTPVEKKLLRVKPGITDISSIVFSDEGDILKGQPDPDIAYNQLIRPSKSLLGLLYIENQSFSLDLRLCFLTFIAIFSREKALLGVHEILRSINAPEHVIWIAQRRQALVPTPPPGSDRIVTSRDGNPFA